MKNLQGGRKDIKKFFIAALAVIVIGVICLQFTGPEDPHKSPESVIEAAIRVQYGWSAQSTLEKLCTEEMLESVNLEDLYLGRSFYTIDKSYKNSIEQDQRIVVRVSVYSPDLRIHIFELIRDESGGYWIQKIEHDA